MSMRELSSGWHGEATSLGVDRAHAHVDHSRARSAPIAQPERLCSSEVARNPTRIGGYDLIAPLATGGMGQIYLGRTTGIGGFERKVVIKTIEAAMGADSSDPEIAMFLDEARLLGLLHHQHIASVFEVGRDDDGRYYMVLDYVDGYSAHDVWERALQFGAALPLDFTLTVVSAAANALHYTHTRREPDGRPLGIVHRDVSPSNVMIGHDGAVKLIDFGIAMAVDRTTKTQAGYVKGKVGYLSPEQVAGKDVDARTDVFALGILLYELTTLQRAFRDTSDVATMQRIKAGKVARPSQLIRDYSLELEAIVMKALQVEPRDRYADADAMRRAVEALGHRLHFVLGDAAVIEVMAQLFDPSAVANQGPASRLSDPAFEWQEFDHDLTVRRDPEELLALMRAELARRPEDSGSATVVLPAPSRKLRAATEAADALMAIQSLELSGGFPVARPPGPPPQPPLPQLLMPQPPPPVGPPPQQPMRQHPPTPASLPLQTLPQHPPPPAGLAQQPLRHPPTPAGLAQQPMRQHPPTPAALAQQPMRQHPPTPAALAQQPMRQHPPTPAPLPQHHLPPGPPVNLVADQPKPVVAEEPATKSNKPVVKSAFNVTLNRPPAGKAPPANRKGGTSPIDAQHQRIARLRWIGAAAVVAVLGTAAYLVTRDSSDAVAGSSSPPVVLPSLARVPPPSPAPPRPVHQDPPAPAPAPTQVRVRVVTHPADATVLLDGKKLGHTPLDETLAADPGKHQMKLRHRGYATQSIDIALDADVTQELTLVPQK